MRKDVVETLHFTVDLGIEPKWLLKAVRKKVGLLRCKISTMSPNSTHTGVKMKRIAAMVLLFAFGWASLATALDLRAEGPKGKNWVKISSIHYMDKTSVKRIKGNTYQANVCNYASTGKIGFWNYFDVRVDCKTRQAWVYSSNKWIGPMDPANYDEGVMKEVCK